MPLEVIYASTDRQLTTTGNVKELVLGATATSTSRDNLLDRHITRASRAVETFLGQDVTLQTYRETVAGMGRRSLMLSRTPVRAVKALYRGTDTDDATVVESSEFILDPEAGLIQRDGGFTWTVPLQGRGNAVWGGDAIPLDPQPLGGQEERPWLVDYVAGYVYAGLSPDSDNWSTEKGTTSTGRTLPEDIETGAILKAQDLHDNKADVRSEKLGDLSVEYNARSVRADGRALEPWEQWLYPYKRMV